ncbi:MAG: C25 family cysteine peptidase, partial [Bacteroidales bacterium]|nr:C25 family cysteine peptidase [Bacteroidales bacterium]
MKRPNVYHFVFLAIMITALAFTTYGQESNPYLSFEQGILQVTDQQSTLPERSTLNGGNKYFSITFNFSGATIASQEVNGEIYDFLNIEGLSKMGQVGAPALPARTEVIAIPPGTNGKIVVTNASYNEYEGFKIHPVLEPARDTEGAPEPKFWIDEKIYGTNAFFPEKVVEITSIALMRGTQLAHTTIRPVQYNPVTGKIRVYTQIDFKIEYEGNGDFDRIADKNSLHFTNLMKRNVINSDNIPDGTDTRSGGNKDVGDMSYIIITHSQYLDAANTLANWKRQLGYGVEVVSQSSWTYTQVENAIQTRYNSWSPRPDYFVIIGDHTGSYAVPGEVINTPYSPPDDGPFATDLYFACMDGSTDWHPDIAHGRISVSSLAEANVIVNKIIDYEKTPPTTSSFYDNVLNCAQYQDDDNNGYADRRFCHTSENIRDYLQNNHGYTSERIYYTSSTYSVSSLRYNNGYYSNGQLLPSALRTTSFDWSGGSSDITNAIDAGKFMVFHRDHGYVGGSGWAHPYYTTSTMTALSNGALQPIVFSMNCHTGEYQLDNCFAEKLMRMENKGAVGVVGATYFSLSGWNDALSIGMIDAIWATPGVYAVFGSGGTGASYMIGDGNEIYTMGDVVNQGLYAMEQNWGGSSTYDKYEYELFMYFGDPAMKIWTENPNSNLISATHSSTIDCELSSFSITGSAANAVATLVFNNEIIGSTTLNASGAGTITYSIPSPGSTVTLTISKTNHKPYIASLIIVGSCNPPAMQTDPATSIGQTTATLNGEILSPNGTVTESGFVYSTSSDPVIGGAGVTQVQTSPLVTNGTFSEPVSGLSLGTTYYVKAYAISDG